MSKCKDCGDDWNHHVPIGFCVASGDGFDQCGCDSIPEGTWVTVDSLAAALKDAEYDPEAWPTDHRLQATAIIQAAKEEEALYAREERRIEDRDDGIIWDDDH